MLESVFNLPARIQALRENPLGASFDSFSQALCDVRYVRSTAKRFIRAAEHFIYWVDRKGIQRWFRFFGHGCKWISVRAI
jgi:integrase/recombinase XerD